MGLAASERSKPFPAEVGHTNVASLRNATTTGRGCLGVPSQAVVGWPKVPRLSHCHSWGTPPQVGQSCGNPPRAPTSYLRFQRTSGIRRQSLLCRNTSLFRESSVASPGGHTKSASGPACCVHSGEQPGPVAGMGLRQPTAIPWPPRKLLALTSSALQGVHRLGIATSSSRSAGGRQQAPCRQFESHFPRRSVSRRSTGHEEDTPLIPRIGQRA